MLKNKENIFRVIVLALLVIVVIFLANYFSNNEAFYKKALENRKEESFSGIVIEKFIDSSQHCTPMLKFTSNSSNPVVNSFWDGVAIGDSIVKNKGQATIYLYKDTLLKQVFDYEAHYQGLIDRKSKK
ncbi:hypothetical protein SGQ83_09065 [Flavobacterium sp. Fl-318]|uniref:Uncharacterized protein n=1 Tax=Flavobacterium cupriresistens TaxID=2893885 RepID=A0ABU4RG53_9FLAO|nr:MULTISPECIES: hypothetical protein [unclassified Flavobacterium]MDX6189496.1 hypothetical protein [Flavobacterium sp. Fl-318]UFH41095.1 hypothetical protein LNP23_14890 [Flavobacterium sp. F-323]